MENDYKSQQSTHESTINEMEKRMVDLRSNIDQLQQMKQKLDDEKNSLYKNNEQSQLQVNIYYFFHRNTKNIYHQTCKVI
jgi:chromosome segregation ATPase